MKWLHDFGDMLLAYAGILMSAISGLFELFRDRFGDRFKGKLWQSLPMIGVIGGMLWALLAAQQDAKQHRQDTEGTIRSVNDWVQKQVTEGTKSVLADVDLLRNQMQSQGVLTSVAQSVSLNQAGEILKAGKEAEKLVSSRSEQDRQALTIYYFDHFTKDVNFERVKPLLDQLAAHVSSFKPLVEAPTNSVWWGPGSSIEQAKAAALIVTGAGVPVVQICPSIKKQPGVTNLIQIGGSANALNEQQNQKMKPMTTEEIESLTTPRCARGSNTEN